MTRNPGSGTARLVVAAIVAAVALAKAGGALAQTVPVVTLRQMASGLVNPVHVAHAGDGTNRLFIVEQAGLIRIYRSGVVQATPFLDIRDRVTSGGEMGLLSVAFHPQYATNGRFFVNYTTEQGGRRSVIAEYRVSGTNPDLADRTERRLLEIPQPFANHNGGLNLFGPDGMLYIGVGDGGGSGDPQNNAQRLDVLLGKILRIHVDGPSPYGIPADNPFVGTAGARPEIWAYGFRNPWRFSIDRPTGRLFVGDVGQNQWEEIDLVRRGGNYGWRIMEGAQCYDPPTGCATGGLEMPIHQYSHTLGCSITGGYVYRAGRIAGLAGRYIFGDFCSGRIWMLQRSSGQWVRSLLIHSALRISSFGEHRNGDLLVTDLRGGLYRLVAPSATFAR